MHSVELRLVVRALRDWSPRFSVKRRSTQRYFPPKPALLQLGMELPPPPPPPPRGVADIVRWILVRRILIRDGRPLQLLSGESSNAASGFSSENTLHA